MLEDAGALNATVADLLRGLVRRFPIEQLIELLQQLPGYLRDDEASQSRLPRRAGRSIGWPVTRAIVSKWRS